MLVLPFTRQGRLFNKFYSSSASLPSEVRCFNRKFCTLSRQGDFQSDIFLTFLLFSVIEILLCWAMSSRSSTSSLIHHFEVVCVFGLFQCFPRSWCAEYLTSVVLPGISFEILVDYSRASFDCFVLLKLLTSCSLFRWLPNSCTLWFGFSIAASMLLQLRCYLLTNIAFNFTLLCIDVVIWLNSFLFSFLFFSAIVVLWIHHIFFGWLVVYWYVLELVWQWVILNYWFL